MIEGIFKGQITEHLVPEQMIYILNPNYSGNTSKLGEDFITLVEKIKEQAPDGYKIEVKPLEFVVSKR